MRWKCIYLRFMSMRIHSILCYKSYSVDKTKNSVSLNSEILRELSFALSKMITRSQKRKAIEELVSVHQETPLSWNNKSKNPVAGRSKSAKVHTENLEEIRFTLRKEILSVVTKILAEDQKEMLKLIAPVAKNKPPWLFLKNLKKFNSL